MSDRRAATTIGELDIHLSILQRQMSDISAAVGGMATKEDIQAIANQMKDFATKEELKSAEARWQKESLTNTLDRWLSIGTRLGVFIAVMTGVVGGLVTMIRYLDSLPK